MTTSKTEALAAERFGNLLALEGSRRLIDAWNEYQETIAQAEGGEPSEHCQLNGCEHRKAGFPVWQTHPAKAGGDVSVPVCEVLALYRHCVNIMESGRDQIISLGGDCDSVDKMEQADPVLRRIRAALAPSAVVPVEAVAIEGVGNLELGWSTKPAAPASGGDGPLLCGCGCGREVCRHCGNETSGPDGVQDIPLLEELRKLRLALAARDGDGVLVPREPTDAMIRAGMEYARSEITGVKHGFSAGAIYRAMLAAAPKGEVSG